MASRMVLMPEDQAALAMQQKMSITPQLRSLTEIDQVMNHVLNNNSLSKSKKSKLYNQLLMRKRRVSDAYHREGIPSVRLTSPTPTRTLPRSLDSTGHITPAPYRESQSPSKTTPKNQPQKRKALKATPSASPLPKFSLSTPSTSKDPYDGRATPPFPEVEDYFPTPSPTPVSRRTRSKGSNFRNWQSLNR